MKCFGNLKSKFQIEISKVKIDDFKLLEKS